MKCWLNVEVGLQLQVYICELGCLRDSADTEFCLVFLLPYVTLCFACYTELAKILTNHKEFCVTFRGILYTFMYEDDFIWYKSEIIQIGVRNDWMEHFLDWTTLMCQ